MFYDTVIFDLDDTLLDRNRSLYNFIDIFKIKYAHLMDSNSNLIVKDLLIQLDCMGDKPRNEMFKELMDQTTWNSKPDIQELVHFWDTEYPNCAEPMPEAYDILDYLHNRNIKIAIVTNGSTPMQNTKINKLNLRKYINTFIISEEVGIRKPDAAIFRLALSKLNSKPETTLFVGDNPLNDITGANQAGLTSIWFSHGDTWNNAHHAPNYMIHNLSEIKRLPIK